ncbi:hypothetical protein SAMN04488107_1765 [Geodermatophilus saharensis]|uniref:Uncharacterized protein n=1 Tax=Geodermatophilus saharensis TaxID=1137994 RepID=A0A239CQF1_9ACTN|nr:hypothetical protein [Geodermatophilus saharensis]SNS22337.1 hypothetical protein SAMN04488107_1765 [Geodermatophilus saharensis]
MATPTTPTPGDDRRPEMSPDEKLIAQWEAQHDVAARGHRGDPLGLQRSLTRERLADCARRGATASGAGSSRAGASRAGASRAGASRAGASGGAAVPRPAPDDAAAGMGEGDVCVAPWAAAQAAEAAEDPAPARRHPWRRFRHHASEH